ncbi:hypothetical protein DFS34DRAFT_619082 [Phlyctochytrium arcticum]|nr:hypothetical protein DFS34DRAFT_619082 [Phlyctochytrium arcticum]
MDTKKSLSIPILGRSDYLKSDAVLLPGIKKTTQAYFLNQQRQDVILKVHYLQTLLCLACGIIFTTVLTLVLQTPIWHIKSTTLWFLLSLSHVFLYPAAFQFYLRSKESQTWQRCYGLRMMSLSIHLLIFCEYVVGLLVLGYQTYGSRWNPTPYLWYATYISGLLLLTIAYADVTDARDISLLRRSSKIVCLFIFLVGFMYIPLYTHLFQGILDPKLLSITICITTAGIGYLTQYLNQRVIESMSWNMTLGSSSYSSLNWKAFMEEYVHVTQ